MEKELFRQIAISMSIAGIILGIILAVPVINVLALFVIFALVGIFALFQYTGSSKSKLETKDSVILSAGGSFICAFCACIVFFPVAYIFNAYGAKSLFEGINLLFIIFLAFFFSLICAMTNAFAGSVFTYIYNVFKKQ